MGIGDGGRGGVDGSGDMAGGGEEEGGRRRGGEC
jgi:hypothetical protein